MPISDNLLNPTYILQQLLRCPSVTPEEAGVISCVTDFAQQLGFQTERVTFSDPQSPDVENFYASIGQGKGKHLLCAGHLDVVPPGDLSLWRHPPFAAEIENNELYGRGTVDMKGGVACFLAALARFLKKQPTYGKISIALTCDEEKLAINGTKKLLKWAANKGEKWDFALNAEPTNPDKIGTTIKVGRRGSLSAILTVKGQSGHVAYPELSQNPIPILLNLLGLLSAEPLDAGNNYFDPSNLEITSVDVGNQAHNVIPAQAQAHFNIRFNDHWTPSRLKQEICNRLDRASTQNYQIEWIVNPAESFVTDSPELFQHIAQAIKDVTKIIPQASTSGGTSDARFIKDYCPVIEFGLVGKTMHQNNERVALDDLETLTQIYENFFSRLFNDKNL